MFLLSKVVRTNLFIQYCLTFSRNLHKCIYRHRRSLLAEVRESQAMIFVRNHFPIITTCFSFSTNIASLYVKDIEQLPSSGNFITSDIPDILFCHSEILNFLLRIYLQNKRKELKIAWT